MDDWRSRWKGRTTITVADFILLTFDIDPATVEQQPASGYRTEQILDAIQHSGLASGLGYDQPVHKLLRPTTGRQAENELREHATNRLLYFKDAVAFAVEHGQWDIPEWLQATYRGTTVPFEKPRKISAELQQAMDRIAELEAEVTRLQATPSPVTIDHSMIRGDTFKRLASAIEAFRSKYPDRTKRIKLDTDLRPWLVENKFTRNEREKTVFSTIICEHFKLEEWDIGP